MHGKGLFGVIGIGIGEVRKGRDWVERGLWLGIRELIAWFVAFGVLLSYLLIFDGCQRALVLPSWSEITSCSGSPLFFSSFAFTFISTNTKVWSCLGVCKWLLAEQSKYVLQAPMCQSLETGRLFQLYQAKNDFSTSCGIKLCLLK